MIITTTPSIEGKRITAYHGIVSGEAIMGANFVRDFFARVRDVIGGRSGSYEKVLRKGKETALKDMEAMAWENGANAIIGVTLGYEALGESNSMLMITASGTAVTVE